MKSLITRSIIAFGILFSSCSSSTVTDISAYLNYLSDPENGLVSEKTINGIRVRIKYLPAEYMAYREISAGNLSPDLNDSLINYYKRTVNVVLSMDPAEKSEADITYRGVFDVQQFNERVQDLNFRLEEAITLRAGGKDYKPVLSALENIYGLKPGRNVLLVFCPPSKEDSELFTAQELEFEYDDFLFDMGKSFFLIKRNNIENVPHFNFRKNRS